MLFNSIHFLFFFPIVTLSYFALPHKIRWIWLLICSYYFYMAWNPTYAMLMLTSTAITYLSGYLISWSDQKENRRRAELEKKMWVALSFGSNLAILFFYKYLDFALLNVNRILSLIGISAIHHEFDIILPVGISFYTFQALSYTMDVYRSDIKAERNFGKYALFVSFFPQLVAGPIERSKNLLQQLHERHYFNSNQVKNGLLLMMWGLFQKIVIADRIAGIVDAVLNEYHLYSGISLMFAMVLFAVQIYCDFSGYTDIAIGAAQVMGFQLMENFRQPYFSSSIKEFWQRWHISLSTWFKDYLYIPLGGSRCSKLKYYRNLLITFLVSGLWHGASWNYVIWGGLHGVYQIVGDATKPFREKLYRKLKIRTDTYSFKLGQIFVTFVLVTFAWLFFRAPSASVAIDILYQIYDQMKIETLLSLNTYLLCTDIQEFMGIMAAVFVLIIADAGRAFWGVNFRNVLEKQNFLFRWIAYFIGIFILLRFGVYGADYAQTQFIYFQF